MSIRQPRSHTIEGSDHITPRGYRTLEIIRNTSAHSNMLAFLATGPRITRRTYGVNGVKAPKWPAAEASACTNPRRIIGNTSRAVGSIMSAHLER